MLPEKLSNGLCSLNPGVDRLCVFADIQVAASGKITKFQFGEGVMRSHHRLTYTQVGAVLEQPESPLARDLVKRLDKPTLTMLHQYHDLYGALRSQRDERGAIDFETTETRRSEEHTSELQSRPHLVCRLLLRRLPSSTLFPYTTLFRSHRLTYTQVGAVLEQPESPLARDLVKRLDKPTLTMLHQYHDLYGALRSQRDERGAIDF